MKNLVGNGSESRLSCLVRPCHTDIMTLSPIDMLSALQLECRQKR